METTLCYRRRDDVLTYARGVVEVSTGAFHAKSSMRATDPIRGGGLAILPSSMTWAREVTLEFDDDADPTQIDAARRAGWVVVIHDGALVATE